MYVYVFLSVYIPFYISRKFYIPSPTLHFSLVSWKFLWRSVWLHCVNVPYFIQLVSWQIDIWIISSILLLQKVLQWIALCIYFAFYFCHARVFVGSIPNSGVAGLKRRYMCNFVRYCQVLLHGVVPFCIPISNIWECLCFRNISNRVCCQTVIFFLIREEIVSHNSFLFSV